MKRASLARALVLAAAAIVSACGGGGGGGKGASEPAGRLGPRHDLQCTPRAVEDELACKYRGKDCRFGPPLECSGVRPPPDHDERRRAALAAATLPCACSCEEDRVACSLRP